MEGGNVVNIGIQKRLFHYKSLPELTRDQKEIIVGLMLSDGHIRNPNKNRRLGGNFRLEFTFKEST
jgi:hypothetical protein